MSERLLHKVNKETPPLTGISPEDIGAAGRVIRIEYVPLSALVARKAEKNAKKHRLDEIDASMRRHGYTAPVMIDEGTERLVAGHGRIDTLEERRLGGREPPDGVVARDGEWFVPVVRGISFADPVEAMSYLLADNRIQEIGGYDWHEAHVIARQVAESSEGLTGTGFVDLTEIEARMEGAVKDFLRDEQELPDPRDEEKQRIPDGDDEGDGKADVTFKFGPYSFTVPREKWSTWLDDVRLGGGFDKASIIDTIRGRLGI